MILHGSCCARCGARRADDSWLEVVRVAPASRLYPLVPFLFIDVRCCLDCARAYPW